LRVALAVPDAHRQPTGRCEAEARRRTSVRTRAMSGNRAQHIRMHLRDLVEAFAGAAVIQNDGDAGCDRGLC
jgi:hypothetical protein